MVFWGRNGESQLVGMQRMALGKFYPLNHSATYCVPGSEDIAVNKISSKSQPYGAYIYRRGDSKMDGKHKIYQMMPRAMAKTRQGRGAAQGTNLKYTAPCKPPTFPGFPAAFSNLFCLQ